MKEDFAITMESDKPFDTVVANIEENVPKHQFRVLAVHDVQATLEEKGLDLEPLKIIEVCNAKFAHQALHREGDVALFMPCRYAVYERAGKTTVKLARPSVISAMLPEAELENLAGEVEETLKKIMRESI